MSFLGACTMEKITQSEKTARNSEQSQVLYIDGFKVTVRYSGQRNPAAVRNIKSTLLSGGAAKKNCFFALFVEICDNNGVDMYLEN